MRKDDADFRDALIEPTARRSNSRKVEQLREIEAAFETLIGACPGQGALHFCSIIDALNHRAKVPTQAAEGRPNTIGPAQEMKIATFTIEGMHCDGRASTTSRLIERSLGDPHRA